MKITSGLIWSIVKRFIGRGYEKDDLYQIACMGFIEAVKRFSFEFNVKLSTYSVQYMIGEIKKFLRDDGMIKVSRSLKEVGIKISELEKKYNSTNGEKLGTKKLSEMLEVPEETIYMAIDACKGAISINSNICETGDEIIETISSNVDEQNNIINKITISEMLKKLNLRDRQIISLRYFKDKTQSQVAKILGISQVHVSRIEKKILTDFRRILLVDSR